MRSKRRQRTVASIVPVESVFVRMKQAETERNRSVSKTHASGRQHIGKMNVNLDERTCGRARAWWPTKRCTIGR